MSPLELVPLAFPCIGVPVYVVMLVVRLAMEIKYDDPAKSRLGPRWAYIAGSALLPFGPIFLLVALERSDPLDYANADLLFMLWGLAGVAVLAVAVALVVVGSKVSHSPQS
jgi:hypothetical protein